MRIAFVSLAGTVLALLPALSVPAEAPAPAPGVRVTTVGGVRSGQPLFQGTCAACHLEEAITIGGRVAPALQTLRDLPPERLYETMVSGKMQDQAAALSDTQKRQVAEWLAQRAIGSATAGDMSAMQNHCSSDAPLAASVDAPSWSGWGAGPDNARFQTAAAAGLSADDVKHLELKWAFGLPQGADSFSQPSVAAGRVFVGSDNGFMYSIDAKSGCIHWSFRADSAIRSAPTFVQAVPGGAAPFLLFFGDAQKRVYALDAQTGRQLWKTRVDDQFRSHMTASPTYHDGRLFVPISATETLVGGNPNYECCKMRGAVVAVEAATGKVLWRTETIAEQARPRGTNQAGVQLWGPAGASVWNTPTVDAKRGLVYVGTGNGYTAPAAPTTDSVLALDVRTGRIVWHHQEFSGDAFIGACARENAPGGNCPEKLGPDWDFGGASMVLQALPGGGDVLIAAGKGGIALGLDPDEQGKVLWRTTLYDGEPPSAGGLVVFGSTADGDRVYYPLNQPGGGLAAVSVRDGTRLWTRTGFTNDHRGQSAAASSMPGVVFTGAWDGVLRAFSSAGELLWSFDTAREFDTVNGVPARGGSLGQPGAAIAGGMVFVGSGYVGTQGGAPGNVILAFSPQ